MEIVSTSRNDQREKHTFFEDFPKVDFHTLDRLTLALVYRHRPSEDQRDLYHRTSQHPTTGESVAQQGCDEE